MSEWDKESITKANYTVSGPYKGTPKPAGNGFYQQWKVSFNAEYTSLHPHVERQFTRSSKEAALKKADSIVKDVAKFGGSVVSFDRDELFKIANQAAQIGRNPIELLKNANKFDLGSNPEALDSPLSEYWEGFRIHASSGWSLRVASQWDSFFRRYKIFFDQKVGIFLESRNGKAAIEALLKKVAEDNQGDPAPNTLKNYRAKAHCFLIWLSLTGEIPQLTEGIVKQAFFNANLPKSSPKFEFNPIITPDQALLLLREFSKAKLSTYAVLKIFMGARTMLLHGEQSGAGWKRRFINLDSGKIIIPARHTKTMKKKKGSFHLTIPIDSIPPLRPWLEFSLKADGLDQPDAPIARMTQPAVSRLMDLKILRPYRTAWFPEGAKSFVWQDYYRNALRNSFYSYGLHAVDNNALRTAAENQFNATSYENMDVMPNDAERYFGLMPSDLDDLDPSKIKPLDQNH